MPPASLKNLQLQRPAPVEMTGPQGLPSTISLRTYASAHGSHAHTHFQVLMGLGGELELKREGRGAALVGPTLMLQAWDRIAVRSRHRGAPLTGGR